ncbi:MAG: DUF5606 domain-containing protein [Dyadobacter sp.]|uniref:DUF5606 family protein n=1 Tax=Dyadobacter sp. TaxID=1914288 RepID=UPI001B2A02CF|nr:DUF5606 domain-containing protein [Dyadobacter sp.]MBO9615772.1 DUF5606 domain-containing protein [Dyadobacter sp.]
MSEKVESTGMDLLKEVANVSGKPGLFRILKPSRAGVIVESLDEKREKTLIGPTARVSVLKDVSIFTDGAEESVALSDVFLKIREVHGEEVTLSVKTSSDKELIEFLAEVLPEFDRSKVYVSDIKKVITWYNLLSKYTPEAFAVAEGETVAEAASEVSAPEEEVQEAPAKKAAKKEKSKA